MADLLSDVRGKTVTPQTCEVLVRGVWTCFTVDQTLDLRPERLKRCPECLGKLRAHRPKSAGQRAWFEHDRAHKGCSRDDSFGGRRSRHPKALF